MNQGSVSKTVRRIRTSKAFKRWKPPMQRFGLRFIASLTVIGGLYIALFGIQTFQKNYKSDVQKITDLRAAVSSLNLGVQALSTYSNADEAASTELANSQSGLSSTAKEVKKSLGGAPKQITATDHAAIEKLVSQEQKATYNYQTAYKIFGKALSYDPVGDLGIDIKNPELATRAAAAAEGIIKAASSTALDGSSSGTSSSLSVNGTSQVVSSSARDQLTKQAACFTSLADALNRKDYGGAAATRQRCNQSYTATRKTMLSNILSVSYSKQYASDSQVQTAAILTRLDATVAKLN